MPTVAEILEASGLSKEQVAALDAKVLTGFQGVLSASEQAAESARQHREAAELARRAQEQQYSEKIAPALDQWGNESATLKAENAFYKAQAEAAKANGFIPRDAPGYVPPAADPNAGRAPNGQFVAGAGAVPGSPAYMTQGEVVKGISNATWVIAEHMRLHGAPPPDDVETLLTEATAQRMGFKDYAAKKYNFDARKAEITAAAKQKERDAIVRETEDRVKKELAEQFGNNPNVRSASPSQFTELKKGIESKTMKDPLLQSKQERHASTQSLIHRDLVDNANPQRVN